MNLDHCGCHRLHSDRSNKEFLFQISFRWKTLAKRIDLFCFVSKVIRSRTSQFLHQKASSLTLVSLILIWDRNLPNHPQKTHFKCNFKHLVFRQYLIAIGYLLFPPQVGFILALVDQLIYHFFLHHRSFFDTGYLS